MSMRVGIVIEKLSAHRGGRERSTLDLAKALSDHGCQVEILCMAGQADDDRLTVRALGQRGTSRSTRLGNFLNDVAQASAEHRYDVVHAMLPVPGASVYQLRSGTAAGLRQAHLRRLGPVGRAMRRWTWNLNRARSLLARAEADLIADGRTWLLPVSPMVEQELHVFYGRMQRVRMILNGVSVPPTDAETRLRLRAETRRQWGLNESDFVLLCPAQNFALKGVAQTVRAFSSYCQTPSARPARLVVAGREAERSEGYARMAGGMAGAVQFRPSGDIWPMLAAADAVILLSWYDPCSRVVLEAVGVGVPSITTMLNGAACVLESGAGMVVPSPDDHDAVVSAIAQLARPEVHASCAAQCLESAGRVSIDRHVEELLELYQEIVRT